MKNEDELTRGDTTGLPTSSRTAATDGGDYLISCRLDVENEIREKPRYAGDASPWVEHELTGRRSGTFEADIANCSIDPAVLLLNPSVFEWPGGRMFIAMQVMRVDTHVDPSPRTHVHGRVLGIVQYGPIRIDEPEARRQLGMPAAPLTAPRGRTR